jgi:DNA invertase Pin-like site-specific DNA recombinase
MLGDMKQGEFNMMVVSRLDRISRKPDEIKAFMEFAKDYGVIVLDVASYECTVEKIIEFVKREESRFMSEKIKMGLKHKKDKQ